MSDIGAFIDLMEERLAVRARAANLEDKTELAEVLYEVRDAFLVARADLIDAPLVGRRRLRLTRLRRLFA